MADLIGHPWMQGPVPSQAEVQQELTARHEMLKAP